MRREREERGERGLMRERGDEGRGNMEKEEGGERGMGVWMVKDSEECGFVKGRIWEIA